LKNGVEAIFDGGALSLETGEEGNTIYIKISDTGVGIPMEKIATLFKPFQTTKSTELGLGLTYCKRTVEAHGGRIKVESVVGEGTVFTITLSNNLQVPEIVSTISG